ncbi:hypothetical protein [Sphingomonas sp. Leaf208]|uniref:hypothetical protein n=1 Tax=Sphingomonas sp. Leaf208 TaxID=1735679 RepID=UPI000A944913|nr:hypothetical protein [Sphingomonas sp. Leaf208]
MTQQEAVGPELVSALYSSRDKVDPRIKPLIDIGAPVTKPQRSHKVGGESVEWTPAQHERLQELTGGQAKPKLDALVARTDWRKMDEDEKHDRVCKVTKDATKKVLGGGVGPARVGRVPDGGVKLAGSESLSPGFHIEACRSVLSVTRRGFR